MDDEVWTTDKFAEFVRSKRITVIHFDATWDVGNRPIAQCQMRLAHIRFGTEVAFAEVDVDTEADLARQAGVLNVPAIAYYRDGKFVAALLGADQDIAARINRLRCNQEIGYGDGFDNCSS